jgi:hypothetical protein
MLRLPAIANGASWVLYGDHADPQLGYLVPEVPRLRRAPDGSALLSLLKIRDINGGTGGLLAVQTDLSVTADEQAAALAAFKSATGNTARLADPLWLSGTASLTVPGPQVVDVAGQPALTGAAAASFECGLTPEAATLLQQAGPGLLQVRYGMRALAMLPPCQVHVFLRMAALAGAWSQLGQAAPDQRRDLLVQSGAAGVDVDDDSGNLDHSLRDQLVDWGWSWLDTLIAARTPAAGGPPEGADVEQVMLGANGLPWPFAPAGSLSGPSAADGQWVQDLDLSSAIFPLLRVTTRANALFDADKIAAITVQLSHGQHQHAALLTSAQSTDEWDLAMDPAIGPHYQVAPVVSFAGSSRTLVLPPYSGTARDLLITVVEVGWLRVTVTSAEVDWTLVSGVGVDLRYGDEAAEVPVVEDSLLLDAEHPSQLYQRQIFAPRSQPYQVRLRWSLSDGQTIQGDWVAGSDAVFDVGRPWPEILHVRFRAPGDLTDIAAITVDATLDPDGATPKVRTFELDAQHTEAIWTAGLPAGTPASFRYRVNTSQRNGISTSQDWLPGTGSSTVQVGPMVARLFELTVVADLLDFKTIRLAKVIIDHAGDGSAHQEIMFTPTSPHQVSLKLPMAADEDPDYTWSASYWTAEGSPYSITGTSSHDSVLILPRPPAGQPIPLDERGPAS